MQVARSAASLNSFSSFLIQSPTAQLVWHGRGSKPWRRRAAERLAAEARGERRSSLVEEGGEAWGGGGEDSELWASLEGGEACFRPSRLAAADCDAPRLFRCRSASGTWQVDEVRGFGQVDLLAQHAYVLDGGSQCFVWQGSEARPLDVRTALGFARRYQQAAAAEEGLPTELRAPMPAPSLVAMGAERREFKHAEGHFIEALKWAGACSSATWCSPAAQARLEGQKSIWGHFIEAMKWAGRRSSATWCAQSAQARLEAQKSARWSLHRGIEVEVAKFVRQRSRIQTEHVHAGHQGYP